MNSNIKSDVYLILLGIQTACCFILDGQSPSTVNMTSAATTANTAATTTQKLPHTAPPVPVTCNVCAGPEFLCDKLFAPQTCYPPNNYCINKLSNHIDGTRMVTRHCGNFDICYREWFLGSSDSDKCRNVDDNIMVTLDFDCTFCCTTDNCNKPIKPLDKDLYKDAPAVTMTSTATTSIKATTTETTTATTTSTIAATTETTTAASIPNTATTTTQKLPHTAPPVAVTCNVCAGPEFLCEQLFKPQTCNPPNNYCINKLTNHIDGTRMVTRHCGNFDTCYRNWYLASSDSDRCRNFENNNIITLDFDCTYCCTTDNCNKPIKPLDKDLYKVPQSPSSVKMTSTATTSIKAATTGTPAATTETTTAASIPNTATTTTQKLPHTAPPIAVICNVCAGPEFLCDKLFAPQMCSPPNNYCINKLSNHRDGTRMVTRHCGNFDTCYREWFLGSSDSDRCRTFEENNIITLDFDCTYCCTSDNCNKPIKPLKEDLYNDI